MYLYGMWVNYTLETGADIRDGVALREFTKNKSFQGIILQISLHINNY